ncbi:MAG: arginyltransferase [Myxococcota bacterium]|jgi:leucyl-tRNA---protein transferase|nr:arginyltransferase [Myxococcota bacterium]
MTHGVHAPYRLVLGTPPELVVHDEVGRCPYLDGRLSRLPLRIPTRPLTTKELGERLASGDRRQGIFLYRTECPSCTACEPIRIDVQRFRPGRTLRRTLRKNDARFQVELGPPEVNERRIALYNAHKEQRGLDSGRSPLDAAGYREFLVLSSCATFEVRYLLDGELVGVAVVDRAEDSLSAVYCYYDPTHTDSSLGTYSILKQIELCKRFGLRYLYLGLYIAESEHMRYKARFLPHERLIGGSWLEISKDSSP